MGTESRVIAAAGLLLLAATAWAQSGSAAYLHTVEVAPGIAVTLPSAWQVAAKLRDAIELDRPSLARTGKLDAWLTIATQVGRDRSDAMRHLADIALEYREPYQLIVIGGWPALERRRSAPLPQPGRGSEGGGKQRPPGAGEELIKPRQEPGEAPRLTVAIAAGASLLRFEATVSPRADPQIADEAAQIARGVRLSAEGDRASAEKELTSLKAEIERRRSARPAPESGPRPPAAGATRSKEGDTPADPVFVANGFGEIEVAASADGQKVVVAARGLDAYSTNGGASFTLGGGHCIYDGKKGGCDSDPSLAAGKSGTFYLSWIGVHEDGTTWTNSVSASADGNSWSFVADAVASANVPDQEHIAADPWHASANGDQIYVVNRVPRITCSADSGKKWVDQVALEPGGDFPRVGVGPDGAAYVVYVNGGLVKLDKFQPCNFTPPLAHVPGFPYMVAAYVDVQCPVAGLDRCNGGQNILSSPTVAVDDLDASHVYVAFASHTSDTGLGNDDVQVWDSQNGGESWLRHVNVNFPVPARRFMPWLATYGGVAYVGWYDRRNATAGQNDLTRYFLGSAAVHGGELVSGLETDLSQVDDPQCASGWSCGIAEKANADACSTPQKAGLCRQQADPSSGSSNTCDLNATMSGCPTGETCQAIDGCPRYGDYNGMAASAGRIFNAWVSAKPPPGVTPPSSGINVYASKVLAPSDFYVRDWTDSPNSFDNGAEPSTHADFVDTSDVWNQTVQQPASPANGYVAGENAQRGAQNYAFVRVSRRAAAASEAPPVKVMAHFYSADFGLGAPFSHIGDESLNFAATDMTMVSAGHLWIVAEGASTHVCLAVEIESPDDLILPPSLSTTSPGPGDPMVLADNNKAQRNLLAPKAAGTAGSEFFAIVHNAELVTSTITLAYEIPAEIAGGIEGGEVGVIGEQAQPLAGSGRLLLHDMQPGENRWIRLQLGGFERARASILPVRFTQVHEGQAVNGFTIAVQRAAVASVARQNLLFQADLMDRLAVVSRSVVARLEAAKAREATEGRERKERESSDARRYTEKPAAGGQTDIDPQVYASWLKRRLPALRRLALRELKRDSLGDPFGVAASLRDLAATAARADVAALTVYHNNVLQRLDAHLTSAAKAHGDPADIPQTVRWQRAVLGQLRGCPDCPQLAAESTAFIASYGRRRPEVSGYRELMQKSARELGAVARQLAGRDAELPRLAHRIERALWGPLGRLEKAHREYLVHLARQAVSDAH
jgi:hypothetical protein